MPSKSIKKGFFLTLVVIVFLLSSTLILNKKKSQGDPNFQFDFKRSKIKQIRNQMKYPENISTKKVLDNSPYSKIIKYMFRGPFSSKHIDIFANQLNSDIVCDADYKDETCTLNLNSNYNWFSLSTKLRDLLVHYCTKDIENTVFVKMDDDLIVSNGQLNKLIERFSKTDCLLAGDIATDYPFYWGLGKLYLFKSSALLKICNTEVLEEKPFIRNEDIYMGYLLNITDTSKVCGINKFIDYYHKYYSDHRVRISYFQQHNDK
ncbi:hypothetical protein BB560_006430 [Smittium megazygosporum]|uniref:Hexosyltransferase n=1 Tax=Smittium megazygosporum TaxID=133381 RepID=A0A2T9Y656_9FUNG|nr:hypothetical protein BB560_006430 [Smittium megazygosporum]